MKTNHENESEQVSKPQPSRIDQRRIEFQKWMEDEGEDVKTAVMTCASKGSSYAHNLMEHALWRAFTAGDNHGRNNA